MTDASLEGVCVLVTRPEALGGPLARLVADAGGEAIRQPGVEIVPSDDLDAIRQRLEGEGPFDIVVFVSVNAVNFGLDVLPPEQDGKPLLAAIGPATRRALEKARRCDISPASGYTSEDLLAEPELLTVDGKRIVIVRGTGGRELLFEELDQRGALVHFAEVYERRAPPSLPDAVVKRLIAGKIDLVTATSVEILNNTVASVDGEAYDALLRCQLVTASTRVVKKAAELGFRHPALLAGAPDDGALLAAMQAWQQQRLQQANARRSPPGPPLQQDSSMTSQQAAGQTESDERPESPTPAASAPPQPDAGPPPPNSGRQGTALALLAMLIALAAGAGAAYTWRQQSSLVSDLEALNAVALADGRAVAAEVQAIADQLKADAAAADRQTQNAAGQAAARVAADIAGLETSAAELRAAQQRLASGISDNSGAIDRLSGRIQGTEAAIDTLRGVSATVRQSWILAQAEYFLVTANDALLLSGDPDVALAALQNADARLQELGDPGLSATRAALAREIGALRAMPKPDIEGIVHELGGLAARIDELNVDNEQPSQFGSDTEREAEGDSAWDRARSVVSAAVRDTITVRRSSAEDKPLLAPDEVFFLRRNIELQLEVARLAALRGEPAVYAESLGSARRWLTNWFDPEDAAVGSAVDALTRLESQDIKPAIPDISASLRALRAAPVQRGDGR